jgi:hypothetical protein
MTGRRSIYATVLAVRLRAVNFCSQFAAIVNFLLHFKATKEMDGMQASVVQQLLLPASRLQKLNKSEDYFHLITHGSQAGVWYDTAPSSWT